MFIIFLQKLLPKKYLKVFLSHIYRSVTIRKIGLAKGKWNITYTSPDGKIFWTKEKLQQYIEASNSNEIVNFDINFELDDNLKRLRRIWKLYKLNEKATGNNLEKNEKESTKRQGVVPHQNSHYNHPIAPYQGSYGGYPEQYHHPNTGANFPPNYPPYPNYNQPFFPTPIPHPPPASSSSWNKDHIPNAADQQQQSAIIPVARTTNNEKTGYKFVHCAKCSWHFKFMENSSEQDSRNRIALDSHMMEAHYEQPGNCTFCLSKDGIHPNSNTYKCGYKPFKCEICNFCTNSKGNC